MHARRGRADGAGAGVADAGVAEAMPLCEVGIFEQYLAAAEGRWDEMFIAFDADGVQRTWGQFATEATHLAEGLLHLGLLPGDRLAIWLHNHYEWVLMQFACHRCGIIVVNINPGCALPELRHALTCVQCRAILLQPQELSTDFAAMLHSIAGEVPDLSHIFLRSETPLHPPAAGPRAVGVWEAVRLGAAAAEHGDNSAERCGPPVMSSALRAAVVEVDPRGAANIQYTSGSTGLPKPVVLTHVGLLNNGFSVGHRMGIRSGDPTEAMCVPCSLHHIAAIALGMMCAISHAVPVVFPSVRFDARSTLLSAQRHRCTSIHGVPTMFSKMLHLLQEGGLGGADANPCPTLRGGTIGGAPVPPSLLQRLYSVLGMSSITVCYGMTETSPISFQTPHGMPLEEKCCSVGHLHPHLEAKVIRSDGRAAGDGETGELCIRGYSVTPGYFGMPGKTAESLTEDGFFRTGDLAAFRPSSGGGGVGKVCQIAGREKDMIIVGDASNVFPAEIESHLLKHPGVKDVAVVGAPLSEGGAVVAEAVCAFVIPSNAPGAVSLEGLAAFCKGVLAAHKIPTLLHVVGAFPLTASGKVQKFALKEMLAELASEVCLP